MVLFSVLLSSGFDLTTVVVLASVVVLSQSLGVVLLLAYLKNGTVPSVVVLRP